AAEKNIGLAIAAYRAMLDAHPQCRLVIVGDGPLRRRLERAHLQLFFTGMLTGEALAAHFASADLFLFPSETENIRERHARSAGERARGGGLRLRGRPGARPAGTHRTPRAARRRRRVRGGGGHGAAAPG